METPTFVPLDSAGAASSVAASSAGAASSVAASSAGAAVSADPEPQPTNVAATIVVAKIMLNNFFFMFRFPPLFILNDFVAKQTSRSLANIMYHKRIRNNLRLSSNF